MSAPAKAAKAPPTNRATVNAADFAAALGAVLHAVARDDVRWGLNGVDVSSNYMGAGSVGVSGLQFTATQGHFLARTTVAIEPATIPAEPGWPRWPLRRNELLSLDGAQALVAAAKRAGTLPLDLVQGDGGKRGLLLYLGDAALAAGEVIGGEFPDCDAVIRTSTPGRPFPHKCTVTVDRKALLRALADVQAPARDRAKRAHAIRKAALAEAKAVRKAALEPLKAALAEARAAKKTAIAAAKAGGEKGAIKAAREATKPAIDSARIPLELVKRNHKAIVEDADEALTVVCKARDVTVVALRLDNADVGRLTVEVPARAAVWAVLDEKPPTVDERPVEAHASIRATIDWDMSGLERGIGFNLVYLRDALAHAKCAGAAEIEIGIEHALAPVHIEPVGADGAVTYLGVVMPIRLD